MIADIVFLLIITVCFLIVQQVVCLLPYLKVKKITGNKTPHNLGLEYENIELIVKDKSKIRGWYIKANGYNTVIIYHNLNGNKEKYLKRIHHLHHLGWNVVIFDLRSHGESDFTGNRIYKKIVTDGIEIICYVQKYVALHKGKIVLYGFSLGTYVAASCLQVDGVDGAIFDSGPAVNINKALQDMVLRLVKTEKDKKFLYILTKPFYGIQKTYMKKMMENFRVTLKPILFIHGEKDEFISWKDSKKMYDICPSNRKTYFLVKDSHHLTNDIYNPEGYEKRVTNFLNLLRR